MARDIPVNEALDTIAELADNNYVWDILCALRGPDIQGFEDIKYATTGVIRYHLLKRKHEFPVYDNNEVDDSFYGSMLNSDRENYKELRLKYANVSQENFQSFDVSLRVKELAHFLGHAFQAFKALGLSWDEVNK